MVSLRLLQLAFSERKCLASGKILYEVSSAIKATKTFAVQVPTFVQLLPSWFLFLFRVWSTVRSVTVKS